MVIAVELCLYQQAETAVGVFGFVIWEELVNYKWCGGKA
jgi:hypothetical protein